jgi:hypothetical protein
MRGLTKQQKRLLDIYSEALVVEDLPENIRERLILMNEYETLFQDASRHLMDNRMRAEARKETKHGK